MNYIKYISLCALSSLTLVGMEYSQSNLIGHIKNQSLPPHSVDVPNLVYENPHVNIFQMQVPVTSHDFNLPVDELAIVHKIQAGSPQNSPATTPVKALVNATRDLQTLVRKKLFDEVPLDQEVHNGSAVVSVPKAPTPAPAVSSNTPEFTQTVVIPWNQTRAQKKIRPYDKDIMVVTAKPTLFTGALPGPRKRKKITKELAPSAELRQDKNPVNALDDEFLTSDESQDTDSLSDISQFNLGDEIPTHNPSNAVSDLSIKQLIQVKGQLRTIKPEHASMTQFSLRDSETTKPKRKSTATSKTQKKQDPAKKPEHANIVKFSLKGPKKHKAQRNSLNHKTQLSDISQFSLEGENPPQNPINAVSDLSIKKLIQVKSQDRTIKPEHANMTQFSLKGPKKPRLERKLFVTITAPSSKKN